LLGGEKGAAITQNAYRRAFLAAYAPIAGGSTANPGRQPVGMHQGRATGNRCRRCQIGDDQGVVLADGCLNVKPWPGMTRARLFVGASRLREPTVTDAASALFL